jgi:hypothetical protein
MIGRDMVPYAFAGQAILMENQTSFTILSQPDENTCGPTCLHAIYNYNNDLFPLDRETKGCSWKT